jgi:DNA-binding NtrC family response regulator
MPADLLEIELFGRENNPSSGSSRAFGKLEFGQRGTILLDEITEMPLALQARVFKVLQGKQVARSGDVKPTETDVRILAASSEKMDRALEEKRMHGDLYYRLSAFTVHIPSLRHRKDEIATLLRYSMHKVAKYYGLPQRDFTRATLEACQNYPWPGNLKELETFVKRYLIAGDVELPSSLETSERPQGLPLIGEHAEVVTGENSSSPQSLKSMIQSVRWETERSAIASALEKTAWNRKAAARLLRISYRTILYKIEQYEMRAPESYLSHIPGTRMNLSGQNKGSGKVS